MKVNRLQVLGYSLLFFLLSTVHCTLYPTYAAESSPSADIQAKLEGLKKDIASKAAQLKQTVLSKLKNKAYVGVVKNKSDDSITLATKNGPRLVNINEDTVFESQLKGKKYSPKLLATEDYIAALGDVDDTGVLTAKKVILLKPSSLPPKTYLGGQVIAISDKLMTLKDQNAKKVAVVITSPTNVKISDFTILTGSFGKNEIFKAEFVYVLPQGRILTPKKIATPSASAKVKP